MNSVATFVLLRFVMHYHLYHVIVVLYSTRHRTLDPMIQLF